MNNQLFNFSRHKIGNHFFVPNEHSERKPGDVVYHKDRNTLNGYASMLPYAFPDGVSKIFEIGVKEGGSLCFWHALTGAKIVGIDIDTSQITPAVRRYAEGKPIVWEQMSSQNYDRVLPFIQEQLGEIDLVIDDGAHILPNMLHNFNQIWPYVRPGGVFAVEDWLALAPKHQILVIEHFRSKIAANTGKKTLGDVDRIFIYRNFIAVRKTQR